MANLLFTDVETNGFHNPRIVQIGAALVDESTMEIRGQFAALIKPDGWQIDPGAYDVHGIPLARCATSGVPIHAALAIFGWMACQARAIVAHNLAFDARVIEGEYNRFNARSGACPLAHRERICTMELSTPRCRLPATGGRGGYKRPKLAEAHRIIAGSDFADAHDAMADVLACVRIYFAMFPPRAATPVPPPSRPPAPPPAARGMGKDPGPEAPIGPPRPAPEPLEAPGEREVPPPPPPAPPARRGSPVSAGRVTGSRAIPGPGSIF